jgi:hypothetical protein
MLLQFKIQVEHIAKPPVWRRVVVPDSFTFEKFHHVIQEAFGWYDCHLYQFSESGYVSNSQIGIPDDSGWDDGSTVDSKKVKLSSVFSAKGQQYTYVYDFGDDWLHKITLEEVLLGATKRASLLAGKGACPPEDCGGPWGYQNILEILADPKHEEYEDTREWLELQEDEKWDPKYFDLAEAQENVAFV